MRTRRIFFLAVVSATIAVTACTDPLTPPSRTGAPTFAARTSTGPTSLDLIEADLAAGRLDRENGNRFRQYAVSAPERLPARYRSGALGKDATPSMLRMALEWDRLSAGTREEILDLQAKGFGYLQETLETPHFVLHYTLAGNHAVPTLDADGNGINDFIDAAAESLEHTWSVEVDQLGYPPPVGTPAQKFHIYFKDMQYYGYTAAENVVLLATAPVNLGTATAYIVVENDFYGFPPNDEDVTGLETVRTGALKVTQAHEFMHAIHFAINVYQGSWLMESHATWAEDAVYDRVNDWHWYVRSFLARPDLPIFSRYVYGSAFFMHWLTGTRGPDLARELWFAARYATAADVVRDVAFGGSWEPMKAFAPAEYLLDIADYAAGTSSVVPVPQVAIRATHDRYPVDVVVPASTNRDPNGAPWGLGANFIEFLPAGGGALTIRFDGADGYAWRAFVLAWPLAGGAPVLAELPLAGDASGSLALPSFGRRYTKAVLAVTVAGMDGVEVPFAYGASLGHLAASGAVE